PSSRFTAPPPAQLSTLSLHDALPISNLTAARADDVGVRLEQADELLAGRHRLTAEHPALALGEDARDQRQIMVNRGAPALGRRPDRKSTRLNSSHVSISYAVFCLKKK